MLAAKVSTRAVMSASRSNAIRPMTRGLATPASDLHSKQVLDAIKNRRTHYAIKPESPISDQELATIVGEAVTHVPTAFNMQSSRAALILGDKNKQLWDALWKSNSESIPEQFRADARKKWDSAYFPSYGTVVFFEDEAVVADWVSKMPDFSKLFPEWSANGTGMLQMTVWAALSNHGLGASLQHFPQMKEANAVALREVLGTPENWVSTAVMPFGKAVAAPAERSYLPLEDRFQVIA